MKFLSFVVPPLENNNYLLIDENSKEAALVDCSSFSSEILEALEENDATLKYILLTHAHFDHVLGVEETVEKTGAKVVLHKDDAGLLEKLNSYTFMMGMPSVNVPQVDILVSDGDKIKLGGEDIIVLHTPGHTKGGCSYYVMGRLYSGDTLFEESIGRTDLEGGDFKTLKQSIENKIYTLPDETPVYPGHGGSTTVGHEKEFNSYI